MKKNDYTQEPGKAGQIVNDIFAIMLRENLTRNQALEVIEFLKARIDKASVLSE